MSNDGTKTAQKAHVAMGASTVNVDAQSNQLLDHKTQSTVPVDVAHPTVSMSGTEASPAVIDKNNKPVNGTTGKAPQPSTIDQSAPNASAINHPVVAISDNNVAHHVVTKTTSGTDDAPQPLATVQHNSKIALSGQTLTAKAQHTDQNDGKEEVGPAGKTTPKIAVTDHPALSINNKDSANQDTVHNTKTPKSESAHSAQQFRTVQQDGSSLALSGRSITAKVQQTNNSDEKGDASAVGKSIPTIAVTDHPVLSINNKDSVGQDTVHKTKTSKSESDHSAKQFATVQQNSKIALSGQAVTAKAQHSDQNDGKGGAASTDTTIPTIAAIDPASMSISDKDAAHHVTETTSGTDNAPQQLKTKQQGGVSVALSGQSVSTKVQDTSPSDGNMGTIDQPSVSEKGKEATRQAATDKVKAQADQQIAEASRPDLSVKQADGNSDGDKTAESATQAVHKAESVATQSIDLDVIKSRRDQIFSKDIVSQLESSALFRSNTAPDPAYLVETNPLLTNYKNFISSDYFLNKVSGDSVGRTGKKVTRLGDGYVEQKLVRDQILAFTGKQTLDNTDIESAYKTLMDNAVDTYKNLGLTSGVELTADQVAQLKKPIVWMVDETVQTDNGPQVVLVPKVYLSAASGFDLRPDGAVVSAAKIDIESAGGITNTGTMLAKEDLSLKGNTIDNGGVLSSQGRASLSALHDINNTNRIQASNDLSLVAGGTISSDTLTTHHKLDMGYYAENSTTADQTATFQGGNVHLAAGKDIRLTGSEVKSSGDLALTAGNNITLNALALTNNRSENNVFLSSFQHHSSTTHQVSQLSGGNIQLSAGNGFTSEGAQIKAKGDLALAANNINLLSVQNHQSSQQSQPQLTASHSSTTQQVSQLSGSTINLSAANGFTSEGVQINAKGDLALAANNINLFSVKNTQDDYSFVGGGHHSVETKDHTESLTGTTLSAGSGLSLTAQHNILSKGSTLTGSSGIALAAGGDVTLASDSTFDSHYRQEKSKHSGFFGSKTKTETTTSQSLTNHGTALSSNGNIQITSGANIQLVGSTAKANGNINLQAKGNIDLLSAVDQQSYHYQKQKKGTFKQKANDKGFNTQTAVASGLTSQGNIALNSGSNITLQGANIDAKNTLSMGAQTVTKDVSGHYVTADGGQVGNLNITTQTLKNNRWDKSSSGFRGIFKDIAKGLVTVAGVAGISTSVTLGHASEDSSYTTTQQASNVAANTLHLKADHNLNIIGSNISAVGNATLSAANVHIDAAKEQSVTTHATTDTTFSSAGPKLKKDELSVVSLTDTDKTDKTTTTATTWSGSHLKAGNLTIKAKDQAAVIASQVDVDGNADIQSNNLLIGGREATTTTQHDDITKTKTLTVGIHNAYVDAALATQNLKKAQDAVSDAQQAYHDAEQKVAAGKMVKEDLDFYKHKLASAKQNVKYAVIAVTSAAATAAMNTTTGGFTATAGTSTQVTTNTSTATQGTWQGSHIQVGNNASLNSQNNLTVKGSTIAANGTLQANAKNIDIEAGKNTTTETSSSRTKGVSASVSYGGGVSGSMGINANNAHSDSSSTQYTNSGLSAGSLVSNSDQLTVKGGNLHGDQVAINTHNLTVTSLQDTAKSHSKSQGGGISIGAGADSRSASVSYNQSKTQSDYASVTHQSSITSGDKGYQIHVANHTHLVGGLITSTGKAEATGKNAFSTGTLTHTDLANHATYSGSSIGAEVGIRSGKDKDGKTTHGLSKSIGRGSEGDSQHSVTHSGINTSNLAINDADQQQQLTGQSASQTVAGIKTATTTQTAQANSGALKNNFDQAEVEKNINHQRSVTQAFGNTVQQVNGALLTKLDGLKEKLKDGKISSAEYEKQSSTLNNEKLLVSAIGAGLLAPTDSATGQWAAAASPVVANQIGQYFKGLAASNKDGKLTNGQEVAHDLAHGIVAAAVASAGGNNAVTTGIAAAGSEAAAPAVAKWLYGTSDPNKLDANQKQTLTAVISAAATTVGATTGNANNAIAAGQAGGNAVANNALAEELATMTIDAVGPRLITMVGGTSAAALTLSKSIEKFQKSPEFNQMTDEQKLATYIALYNLSKDQKLNKTETLPVVQGANHTGGSAIVDQGPTTTSLPMTEKEILDNISTTPKSDEISSNTATVGEDPSVLGLGAVYSEQGGDGVKGSAFTVNNKQLGKKLGKHVEDFGGRASNAVDRKRVTDLIRDIGMNPDKIINGTFAGQGENGARGKVQFRIKGNNVVVTKPDGTFVTILKDGTENSSVKSALGGD